MCTHEGCNLMIHAIEFTDEPCTFVTTKQYLVVYIASTNSYCLETCPFCKQQLSVIRYNINTLGTFNLVL